MTADNIIYISQLQNLSQQLMNLTETHKNLVCYSDAISIGTVKYTPLGNILDSEIPNYHGKLKTKILEYLETEISETKQMIEEKIKQVKVSK